MMNVKRYWMQLQLVLQFHSEMKQAWVIFTVLKYHGMNDYAVVISILVYLPHQTTQQKGQHSKIRFIYLSVGSKRCKWFQLERKLDLGSSMLFFHFNFFYLLYTPQSVLLLFTLVEDHRQDVSYHSAGDRNLGAASKSKRNKLWGLCSPIRQIQIMDQKSHTERLDRK